MARLTRIAVNLFLIVAITIQPTVVFSLKRACSADRTSQLTCQGCGCCEVETSEDQCECCGGPSKVVVEEESASCCGHDGGEDQFSVHATEDESCAAIEIIDERVHKVAPSGGADENLDYLSNSLVVDFACNCLQAPETPHAPVPRSPANEVRDLVSLSFTSRVSVGTRWQLASAPNSADSPPPLGLHYAQVEFCVWRL